MTEYESSTSEARVAPVRGWLWFALVLIAPVAAALTLYGILPTRTPTPNAAFKGGCDHTPGPDGRLACPHGVSTDGGCNMTGSELGSRPQSRLTWTLPLGWTASFTEGSLWYATLAPPPPGDAEVSVSLLPGEAGGEWANVNRWRRQVGLPPVPEAEIKSHRALLESAAGPVAVFDIDNPDSPEGCMAVGMARVEAHTWFFKMTGSRRSVLQARPALMELLGTLRTGNSAAGGSA